MGHENVGYLLGRMVDTLTEELGVPVEGGGTTTHKRQDLDRGAELVGRAGEELQSVAAGIDERGSAGLLSDAQRAVRQRPRAAIIGTAAAIVAGARLMGTPAGERLKERLEQEGGQDGQSWGAPPVATGAKGEPPAPEEAVAAHEPEEVEPVSA